MPLSLALVNFAVATNPDNFSSTPDAERVTGYKVGGIGPFGQKRNVPTALDETAELYDCIYINAGQRGLLLSIAPADAVQAAEMTIADLTA